VVHRDVARTIPTGNLISPLARARAADDADREGTVRELCSPRYGSTTRAPKPAFRAQLLWHRDQQARPTPPAVPPVTRPPGAPLGARGQANPVRLSVARELGRDIDGAWWPRADRINNELADVVAVLTPLLGDISSINVNWSPLERPPDCNWPGWERRHQHVMTISGTLARANLLVISYTTHSTLALLVLRCAAHLPIHATDRDKPAFLTADAIVQAATRQQRGCDRP
jgi:Family of unknown function (DUF5994)